MRTRVVGIFYFTGKIHCKYFPKGPANVRKMTLRCKKKKKKIADDIKNVYPVREKRKYSRQKQPYSSVLERSFSEKSQKRSRNSLMWWNRTSPSKIVIRTSLYNCFEGLLFIILLSPRNLNIFKE